MLGLLMHVAHNERIMHAACSAQSLDY